MFLLQSVLNIRFYYIIGSVRPMKNTICFVEQNIQYLVMVLSMNHTKSVASVFVPHFTRQDQSECSLRLDKY